MELLKELMVIVAEQRIDEAKKSTDRKFGLTMKPIKSFVAGNMIVPNRGVDDEKEGDAVTEGKTKPLVVTPPKARNKQVNDVLRSRKGGAHYDAKKDYVRAKEKQKDQRGADE